jgi:6-phosphogluconolactonase (cycloisomerase 2 family)
MFSEMDAVSGMDAVTGTDTLTVVDLGGDALVDYRIDAHGRLRPDAVRALPAGFGPRHLAGRWVLGELDPAIVELPSGTRRPLAAPGLPSAIVASPDGAHVYAANRGPGTITALGTAPPHTMRDTPAGGELPQDLAFVGDVLYAAVPDADAVTAFRRAADGSGVLTPLGVALHTRDPRCVLPIGPAGRAAPTTRASAPARSADGESGQQTHR